ncbi:VWFA domain-containing protein [Aphelenchoides fujianensis]|nr:VWFA domain-containing protein [Aphelenchoides fujianensis]
MIVYRLLFLFYLLENVDEETTSGVVEKLVDFFGRKVAALQRIVGAAERSTADFDVDAPLVEEEADCVAHQQEMNATDLRNLPENPTVRSGVHVALETFRCDLDVVRDFRWTKVVERQFEQNAEKDPDLLRQYVSTYSGLSRVHPPFRWASEPVSVDLFDPRQRSWFVSAETGPKDIIFLVGLGQTLHLIKTQLEHILVPLNPNDYFSAVWYNSKDSLLVGCMSEGFMLQATTRNKKLFQEYLSKVEAQEQANLPPALNSTLSLFLRAMSTRKPAG